MFNPQFVEHEIATRQADLRREAEMARMAREAGAARARQNTADNIGAGLRSRVGDLLLAYGLKLKRLDTPDAIPGSALVAGIPVGARLAVVSAPPLPEPAPAVAQPVSGFSLLRYDTLPPVGIFFWRLDRLGTGTGSGAGDPQGYLALTWLAARER